MSENIAINNLASVYAHCLAVADRNGQVRMTDPGDDALVRLVADGPERDDGEISCVTLDDFLPNVPISMLKIDVEGAEPLVLRGARKHLAAGNPTVIQIELDGYSARYGLATNEFIAEIESLGYEIAIYDPDHSRLVYTRNSRAHGVLNALAIHRASRDAVESRLARGAAVA